MTLIPLNRVFWLTFPWSINLHSVRTWTFQCYACGFILDWPRSNDKQHELLTFYGYLVYIYIYIYTYIQYHTVYISIYWLHCNWLVLPWQEKNQSEIIVGPMISFSTDSTNVGCPIGKIKDAEYGGDLQTGPWNRQTVPRSDPPPWF